MLIQTEAGWVHLTITQLSMLLEGIDWRPSGMNPQADSDMAFRICAERLAAQINSLQLELEDLHINQGKRGRRSLLSLIYILNSTDALLSAYL